MPWAVAVATVAACLVTFADCATAGSVYCFALVTPGTYEPSLVAAQYLLKVGVFQCDGWDIISNVSAPVLLQGHWAAGYGIKDNFGVVDTDLFVKQVRGPPGFDASSPETLEGSGNFLHASAKHLANTPVFQKVWDKVFELGRWQNYEWTIKLDVDAVPLPLRMRKYLGDRPLKTLDWDPEIPGEQLPYKAEYLYNVRHDMYKNFVHGPAEAVSRGAMRIFQKGHGRCKKEIDPMAFGEDFYLNKCLELLGIPAVEAADVPLLYDTYEWGEVAHVDCFAQKVDGKLQNFSVYHAHKNITDWLDCYEQADSGPAISEDLRRSAIEEATGMVEAPPATVTVTATTATTTATTQTPTATNTRTTSTTTLTFNDTTVVPFTTQVLMQDGVKTESKETQHGWMVRLASEVWPLLSLLAACLVVAPLYARPKKVDQRSVEGADKSQGSAPAWELPLVDSNHSNDTLSFV